MNLKQRIAAGDNLLGTFLKTPHPHNLEVLASTGLDLVCLDAEHAPFDRRDVDACVMAARGSFPVIVRTPDSSAEAILNVLDCGADGVLVPHVLSGQEARRVLACAHYGSGRGFAASSRAAGYGQVSMAEHVAASAKRTVVIAQVEDAEAVDDIEAIAAVEGIDAVFIGRADLTISLGCDNPDDPKVVAACERVIATCVAARRPVGMFTPKFADVPHWRGLGVQIFLLASDHALIRSGVAAMQSATAG